jgi:transcriptional regulator with XRE-family HTH domain
MSSQLIASAIMPSYETRVERVRGSLYLAQEHFPINKLADLLDVSRATLSAYLHGRRPPEKWLQRAEEFARQEGYWVWDGLHPAATAIDPDLRLMANKVRVLADHLSDPDADDVSKASELGALTKALLKSCKSLGISVDELD